MHGLTSTFCRREFEMLHALERPTADGHRNRRSCRWRESRDAESKGAGPTRSPAVVR